jgi:predicted DNA-binding mobile mystery protein A
MKLAKRPLHRQRQALDSKLNHWRALANETIPRKGWLRAIRESLGMTLQQLADRLSTNSATVFRLEERETKQTVSFQALDRAARAIGCKLVYAIVPDTVAENPLDTILEKQARAMAIEQIKSVSHSMRLENQGVGPKESENHVRELTKELKEKLDSRIWNLKK